MQKQQSLEQLLQQVLDKARQYGATHAEAGLSVSQGLEVTTRLGELETIEHHNDQGLAITVYRGQSKGSASTADLSNTAIDNTIKMACDIAHYTNEDQYSGLADKALMPSQILDLDLYHPWDLSVEQAIDITTECETQALEFDAKISNSEGAQLSTHQGLRVYGNTHGFIGSYPSTRHSLGCTMIAEEEQGMQRDGWYSSARDAALLQSVTEIGQIAAQKTLARLGSQPLSTRKASVIFAAEVAPSLLGHLMAACHGSAIYRQSSFLVDALEQQIFPEFIHISQQPHLKSAIASAPFDDEGVLTQSYDLIKQGCLKTYILDSYAARKLNMTTTGNAGGTYNMIIETGDKDLAQLLKQMDTGLLVTELMGQGVNLVTGDYSRGVAGFWVEHGEIQYPVEEITIAGNLKTMYQHLLAVGNDVDLQRNIRTGSLWLAQMTIAGNA